MSSKMIAELMTEVAQEAIEEVRSENEKLKAEITRLKAKNRDTLYQYLEQQHLDKEMKLSQDEWQNFICRFQDDFATECSGIAREMFENYMEDRQSSEEEEENKCCVCAKTLSETDVCQYEFDGKNETYCDGCREENLTTYCVSSKDYKEWWDEDYEYDEGDEDECMYLCIKRIDNSNDAKWQYSIEWGGDESGKMNGINTSSPFAAMCCGWQCDDY